MFDRTYQPGVAVAPVGMADGVGETKWEWRDGFGWVERTTTLCDWHQAVVAGLASDLEAGELDYAKLDADVTIADVTASLAKSCCDCQDVA